MMTVGADRVVLGGTMAGGFMSVLAAAALAEPNPTPPMSSGRTPFMRHTDSTDAAVGVDVCVPVFQNADDTDVTTDCLRCWYCCVTDIESLAAGGDVLLHRDDCCC